MVCRVSEVTSQVKSSQVVCSYAAKVNAVLAGITNTYEPTATLYGARRRIAIWLA